MEKVCVIMNKPVKWWEKILREIIPGVHIAYSSVVYDMNCQSLRIRKHENGELYMFGTPLKNDIEEYIDCHSFCEKIPAGRYIYMKQRKPDTIHLDDYDRIIAMPDLMDFEAYLAIAAYLQIMECDRSKVQCFELDYGKSREEKKKDLIDGLGIHSFGVKFTRILKAHEDEGFVSYYPISRDFVSLQVESRMNNIQFADYFGMSVRNVENWRKDPSSLKDYLYDLFEYKLLKEGII